MKKLNCIVVDDEPLALDILEDHIRRTPTLQLVGRFTSSADALSLMSAQGGDGGRGIELAFLDIQMPGLGGIEFAKIISDETDGNTRVIFTTAFPQYALDGFRIDALDYLLKPISFSEFTRAVDRALEWFSIKRAAEAAESAEKESVSSGPGSEVPRTLIVKSDYKQYVIPIDTIVYIEGIRDYIRIHTTDGSGRAGSVQTLMSMKGVQSLLPSEHFARVHRSWIVNLDHVKKIERTHIVFDDAAFPVPVLIPISDTYKEAFLRSLAARAL